MAKHTKSKFAKLCNVSTAYITMNVKRGKIFLSDDKLIDDEVEENKEFLEKRVIKSNDVNPVLNKEENKSEFEIGAEIIEKSQPEIPKEASLTRLLKAQELEKKKAETKLLKLREEKIRGEVIPIAIVKTIISTLSQAVLTSQKDSIEAILINISKEARLSGDQLAKLRGNMVQALNNGVDKAINISQRNLKTIVEEFSIKKEVGEHD